MGAGSMRGSSAPPLSFDLLAGGLRLATSGLGLSSRPRLIVGGVDLTGINLLHPFDVDFSVPADASLQRKSDALRRVRDAMVAITNRWPTWLVKVQVDVRQGVIQLHVVPSTVGTTPKPPPAK